MFLMTSDFNESYDAVLNAVRTGKIDEDRLNESVTRIIDAKLKLIDDGNEIVPSGN